MLVLRGFSALPHPGSRRGLDLLPASLEKERMQLAGDMPLCSYSKLVYGLLLLQCLPGRTGSLFKRDNGSH